MRVIFRVDASRKIGSGHLIRCLTLSKQLRRRGVEDIVFISRDLDGNFFSLIQNQGNELLILPRHDEDNNLKGYVEWLTVTQDVDAKETVSSLLNYDRIDWLVVDSYAIDYIWEDMVRPYVEHIMAIDDLANRNHNVDVLLDQNFSPQREKDYCGLVPSNCLLLMGLDYLLMREEFYTAKNIGISRDMSIKRIFIFFGGTDLTDETNKALDAMENFPQIAVDVVVGGGNLKVKEIAERCRIHDNWAFHYRIDYISSLMLNADLAIGAGGTTTWERCFLGLPSLVVSVADNQSEGAKYYDSQGILRYLGDASQVDVSDIVKSICCIRENPVDYIKMQEAMQKIFVNHKQGRVAEILTSERR